MARPRIQTLTKQDVIERVCEITGSYAHHAEPWVRAVVQALGDLLSEADPEVRIELRGFGVFEVKTVRANPRARNPRTNEPLFVPSRRKATFRPGKRLKTILQEPVEGEGTSREAGHSPARPSPPAPEEIPTGAPGPGDAAPDA